MQTEFVTRYTGQLTVLSTMNLVGEGDRATVTVS
jgi:hypothetical protein